MNLYDWIFTQLLPLIGGEIPEKELGILTMIFWIVVGALVIHFLMVVPYSFFMKLIGYRGGLLSWREFPRKKQ